MLAGGVSLFASGLGKGGMLHSQLCWFRQVSCSTTTIIYYSNSRVGLPDIDLLGSIIIGGLSLMFTQVGSMVITFQTRNLDVQRCFRET